MEILSAGLDLFIRKGFAATKISDIAKQVNMSTGLMFHYFESKEKLYEELIKYGMSGPQMIMNGDQSDPLSFFENAAKQIFQYAKDDPFVAKMFVLMSQAAYSDGVPVAVKEILKQDDTEIRSALLISRGQQNGTIREGNPAALSLAYWAAIQGVCQTIALNSETPCPESDWIVDILRRK
jgi:AcrR family transcriptional regulator